MSIVINSANLVLKPSQVVTNKARKNNLHAQFFTAKHTIKNFSKIHITWFS